MDDNLNFSKKKNAPNLVPRAIQLQISLCMNDIQSHYKLFKKKIAQTNTHTVVDDGNDGDDNNNQDKP